MSDSSAINLKTIDLTKDVDNQSVIELVSETIIPGPMAYSYDRSPSYHSFAMTQGLSYELYGAYLNKELLGITQITFDHVYLNGTEMDIAYSGDTRIHPKSKGRKIADSLIAKACLIDKPVFGAVMSGNHIVLDKKLSDWKKVGVDFKIIGELKVLLFRAKKRKIKYQIASIKDIPEMYKLWKEIKVKENLSRAYKDEADFLNSYNTQGISLARTVLLKDSERLIGFVSVWNQDAIRKIQIKKIAPIFKFFTTILRLFIKIPKENENLPLQYSFQHCFHPDALKRPEMITQIIKDASSLAFMDGALLFSIGLDVNDPLYGILNKQALDQNKVKIICYDPLQEVDKLAPGVYHFEVGVG